MNDIVAKFLRLPYERRKNVLRDGSLRLRSSHPRKVWERKDVEDYLIVNCVTTARRFRELRRVDEDCPSMTAVKHHYGSWLAAKKQVFPELFTSTRIQTPEQVVALVGDVPVKSWREYQRQRRLNPSMFPPNHLVKKWFGSWNNLKRLACARQLTNVMTRYIILKRQLGRWPTNQECFDAGVEIDYMLSHFKSRSEMRDIVVLFERNTQNAH